MASLEVTVGNLLHVFGLCLRRTQTQLTVELGPLSRVKAGLNETNSLARSGLIPDDQRAVLGMVVYETSISNVSHRERHM